MTILAKHNGVSLKDHSNSVALRAKEIATSLLSGTELKKQFGPQYSTESVITACFVAGLLHDIGKAVPYFQDYITKTEDASAEPDELVDAVTGDATRYHNEFSWAFLCVYGTEICEKFGITDRKCYESVKSAVFWHHAAAPDYGELNYSQKIFYGDQFDIKAIADFVSELVGMEFPERDVQSFVAPNLFAIEPTKYDDNVLTMFVRAVVIRADREVSGYADSFIEDRFNIETIRKPDSFNAERFAQQMDIVNLADKPTNVVAAPAGFGKTLVGMAWALKCRKTVYWVCPRNPVIESVYIGLVQLNDVLGLDVCIEKMYTGEIKGSNREDDGMCPHIVVTNLDAITKPYASNRQANMQYVMMSAPMVFDEFHEFSMDNCPMYAAYCLLIQLRNNFTKAKSLLVSATPITIYNEECFRDDERVNYLPKRNAHYQPQHDVPYNVMVKEVFDKLENGSAQVFNVVADAQEAAKSVEGAICFHSKFTDEDKKAKMDKIYSMYGKGATAEKVGVASGPIMRASLDISFRQIEFMVSTPNGDIQIIGRCDRWGEVIDATIVFVIPSNLSKANRVYLDHNDFEFTHDIYKAWTSYIKTHVKEKMTLSDIYAMLDSFNAENADLLKKYQETLYKKGLEELVKQCYPHRPAFMRKSISNKGNIGSLRNTDPSISFVVKDTDGVYCGPFQIGESYTDFSTFKAKQAFRPYFKADKSELLTHIKSDPSFEEHFPTLYKKLMGKAGKAQSNICQFYGTNPAMWRNPDYPFVVRPSDMAYDHEYGWYEIEPTDPE